MSKKIFAILGAVSIFLAGALTGAVIGPVNFDKNIPTVHIIKEKADEVIGVLNPLNLDVVQFGDG